VGSVRFTDIAALTEAARAADLLVLGGGGLFHDHFGFDAGAVLSPDHGGALFSAIPLLSALLEKPLMILGVGVGPLCSAEARELTRFAFRQSRIATVRDRASKAEVMATGVDRRRVRVLPDPAFIMEPAEEEEIRPVLDAALGTPEPPLLGVALRKWDRGVDEEAWEREVARALDAFLEAHPGRALFVPMQELAHDLVDDRVAARRMRARMRHGKRTVLLEGLGSPAAKSAALGRCQVVLGMRLHSLVFALRTGVPPVTIVYDSKVRSLVAETGLSDLAVEIEGLASEAIVERLEEALRDRERMAPRLRALAAERASAAREHVRLALEVLDGRAPAKEDRGDVLRMLKRVTLGLSSRAAAYHGRIQEQAEAVARLQEQVRSQQEAIDSLTRLVETMRRSRAWRWAEKYRRAWLRLRAVWSPAPGRDVSASSPLSSPDAADGEPSSYDVVCFSIIDWDFRWQRPQQIMSQFAEHGHRVFFISVSRFHRSGDRPYRIYALRKNVWEVQLVLPQDVQVYTKVLAPELAERVVEALAALRDDSRIATGVSVVQVPSWAPAARRAREAFSWPVVYDCMDEWRNFPGMEEASLGEEERLVGEADVLVVSAERLRQKWSRRNGRTVLARNAADFARFHEPPPEDPLPDAQGPVVGYFGAIADWFDLDLMTRLARERPRYTFVLLGGVFDVQVDELQALPNVRLLGQQPYELMPAYLRRFDACLIPFKVSPVTAATDPVKFYEYISQGKPVVASEMPELAPYARLLYLARDGDDFIAKVDQALNEDDPELRRQRIALARENTWQERFGRIDEAVREAVAWTGEDRSPSVSRPCTASA
jgi:polysaccharide pyruvyl transferase WcaK-like protein/glycosyltransferase involved in cell wall biosynthesis